MCADVHVFGFWDRFEYEKTVLSFVSNMSVRVACARMSQCSKQFLCMHKSVFILTITFQYLLYIFQYLYVYTLYVYA